MKHDVNGIKLNTNKIILKLITLYYKLFFNLNVGFFSGKNPHISTYPATGKGKFLSIYQKGKVIQIIDENKELGEIRIIPTIFNGGIFIERWKDNKLIYRNHLDFNQLCSKQIYMGHIEKNNANWIDIY